jgi:hypothetical protein
MEEIVPFGSRFYCALLAALLFARGMDFVSTYVATPRLVLEGNPIARWLGWRWGIPFNIAISCCLAFSALATIVVSTTSVLVAARNFQSAWLMRSVGEEVYRDWHLARIRETRITLYLACLAGNTLLTAAVGGVLMLFSGGEFVPFGIGMGVIAYSVAVALYTLLAVWRIRRSENRRLQREPVGPPMLAE